MARFTKYLEQNFFSDEGNSNFSEDLSLLSDNINDLVEKMENEHKATLVSITPVTAAKPVNINDFASHYTSFTCGFILMFNDNI